jgi:hypothetical protein
MSNGETKDTVNEPAAVEPATVGRTVVMTESKDNSKRRMKIAVVVVFGTLMIVALAGYQVLRPKPPCSDSFLKSAGMHFDGPHRPQLIKDVAQIQLKKDYTKDPNCLYVVMEYNIHSSDSAKATKTYALLQKAYDPSKGFSHSLGPNRKTMADFKASVKFLKKHDVELLKNSFGIPQ